MKRILAMLTACACLLCWLPACAEQTAQLRSQETLTLDNPPMEYIIRF